MSIRRSAGFTLLELLLVLGIIAIGTVAVMPAYQKWSSSNALKASIRELLTGLKRARYEAMFTGQPAAVTLYLTEKNFLVTGDTLARRLPESVGVKLLTVQQEVLTENIAAIRFFPDGSSSGGRITLVGKAQEYDIDVHWLTGRAMLRDPHAPTPANEGSDAPAKPKQ